MTCSDQQKMKMVEGVLGLQAHVNEGIRCGKDNLLLWRSRDADTTRSLFKKLVINEKHRCKRPYWNIFYEYDYATRTYALYLVKRESATRKLECSIDRANHTTMIKYA
jgi:hypothetical protein